MAQITTINTSLKRLGVLIVAGIVYLVGQYFRGVWFLGSAFPNVCGNASADGVPFCNSLYLDTFGWPLITAGQFLAVIGIVLLFATESTWRKWLKFSLFYVPISAALIFWIYPINLFGLITQYEAGVDRAGWLYLIITVIMVLRGRFKTTKGSG